MTHLTRLSLANRLIVGLVAVAILVFGVLAVFALKQELLPAIQAPTALVTARYPGASPQIVATDVSTRSRTPSRPFLASPRSPPDPPTASR